MRHVPLERRSTGRIILSLFGMVIVPMMIFSAFFIYSMWQFVDGVADFVSHWSVPF